MEELNGKLTVATILTNVWLGDWNNYSKVMAQIPQSMKAELSFHSYYSRDEAELWHDNHFFIPGDHFVSPYFSSYSQDGQDEESRRQDLFCLIGLYEKIGFHYPLEMDLYPDHFGCLSAFLVALLQEQMKARQDGDSELVNQLVELEREFHSRYIQPVIQPLLTHATSKINHPFFKEFLRFYGDIMDYEWAY